MNKSTYVETVNNIRAILEEVKCAKDWDAFTSGATQEEIQAMEELPRWCSLLQSWYQELSQPQHNRFVA